MALINCKECKKEISSEAEACPYCGYKKKKVGCLGTIGYVLLGLFVIALIGRCSLGSYAEKAASVTPKVVADPPMKAAAAFFKLNASDKFLTCGTVVSAIVIKENSKVIDSLITCSNNEKYRFVQEHMDMYKGKPKDWWFPHAFKCSNLKGSTLEGWHNPADWGITKENCTSL